MLQHSALGESEMMGSHLCRHVGPQPLRQLHHAHRIGRADMLDVHRRACVKGQHAVPGHQCILCQGRRALDPQRLRSLTRVDAVF